MHKLAFFKVVNSEKIPPLEAFSIGPTVDLLEKTGKVVDVPWGLRSFFQLLQDSKKGKNSDFEAWNMQIGNLQDSCEKNFS